MAVINGSRLPSLRRLNCRAAMGPGLRVGEPRRLGAFDTLGARKRCHNQAEMRIMDARFIVRDANGQALAYVYFEGGAGTPSGGQAAHPRRRPAHRRQHC